MRGQKLMQRFPPKERTDLVCVNCIEDEILKSFFAGRPSGLCTICKKSESSTTTGEILADSSRKIIQAHFQGCAELDGDNPAALTLSEVFGEVTGIEDDEFCQYMANHVLAYPRKGEKDFFKLEKLYVDIHIQSKPNKNQWHLTALDLIHRQRFFNKKAEKFFNILLDEAVNAKTKTLFGVLPAAEKIIDAGKILYRARRSNISVEKDISENPYKALGAPPKKNAAHNRMNPAGISLFYSAAEKETAIAEIRPSIGDRVAVGAFKTTKKLRFFDFRGLNIFPIRNKVSHWYDYYENVIEARSFLNQLHDAISQPVLSGENGYIITQAFTEYLCNNHEEKFDGIIFGSVQHKSGVNYVIFPDKSEDLEYESADWEPTFPLSLPSSPSYHTISAIQYLVDWKGT